MRALTATLKAAQKKSDREPYVEAKVYNLQQGVERLSWTRLYTGTEGDSHHGIAFDDEGSMHRIRVEPPLFAAKLVGADDAEIDGSYVADAFLADRFTAVKSGPMTQFKIKCSGAGHVKVAIYANKTGDKPGDLLNAENVGQEVVAGWNTINFPETQITSGTIYWLASIADAAIIARPAPKVGGYGYYSRYDRPETYATWTFPDPAGDFPYDSTTVKDFVAGWQKDTPTTKLYYQKVADPDDLSDYSSWTLVASDCHGECAIAASGAKVYIFYRKNDNTIRKYYSHDHGASWTNAQVSVLINVLSMSASWWPTTDNVLCFCLKATTLYAVVLDTSTQTAQEFEAVLAPVPDTTYGIGSTYDPGSGNMAVIYAARIDALPYDYYALFRTYLDRIAADNYVFGALKTVISSPDGAEITYEYPDCHQPTSPASREPIRILGVEKYAGITSYKRPLLSHLVIDTAWSDATFIEPWPFLDISADYGLRMATTSAYYWLEEPNGVWRASRGTATGLDISDDILEVHQVVKPDSPGSLVILLDNHAGKYAQPGIGALAKLKKGSQVELKLGYKTTAGIESVEAGTYWVDSWEYQLKPRSSAFELRCIDAWGLADRWIARYSLNWNRTADSPRTLWQIIYELMAHFGIKLWNNPAVTQSSAMTNFQPDFYISPASRGTSEMRRLLSFCPDGLVPYGLKSYTKDLKSDEAHCYDYGTAHVILEASYTEYTPMTRAQVMGRTAADARVIESAFDWDELERGIDNLWLRYDPNLEDAATGQRQADAMMREEAQRAKGGGIRVPVNCGQELYDVIRITDSRVGMTTEKRRIMGMIMDYSRIGSHYQQVLTLGAP